MFILLEILLYYFSFDVFLIHPVAHLTMTTFVQEHLLYLIVYHDITFVCCNTDIVLTSCWLCLFMIREPGIT